MTKQRKQYTEEFKATVALEAVKGEKSLQELAAQYGVPPVRYANGNNSCSKDQRSCLSVRIRQTKMSENRKKINDLEQLVGQREYELA